MLPTPRGLSQSATSFIASRCQGIHQMPLSRLRWHPCTGANPAHERRVFSDRHDLAGVSSARSRGPFADDVLDLFTMSNSSRPVWDAENPIRPRGGGERIRTDDPLLAKQALSQLSYTPVSRSQTSERPNLHLCHLISGWWARVDLNYRPHAYQACALTELSYGPKSRCQSTEV